MVVSETWIIMITASTPVFISLPFLYLWKYSYGTVCISVTKWAVQRHFYTLCCLYSLHSSIPRSLPAFQCCTLKSERASYAMAHDCLNHVAMCMALEPLLATARFTFSLESSL